MNALPAETNFENSSDENLVNAVKENQDSNAILHILSRHSGIYSMMVNRFGAIASFDKGELMDDMSYNIYNYVMSYDTNSPMKLGTYIGERTRYQCLKNLEKNKRKIASYISDTDPDENIEDLAHKYVHLDKDDPSLTETITGIDSESIMSVAEKHINDPIASKVIRSIHFPKNGRNTSFKDAGSEAGVSREWARQTYRKNIKKVIALLAKEK